MSENQQNLPPGKLPAHMLEQLLSLHTSRDHRLIQGPGTGLDCAIIDLGDRLLALKSDPITFAADSIGWYAVQVNANDLATAGASPSWFMPTLLLPERGTTVSMIEDVFRQIETACAQIGVTVIGGHTEITVGLTRPIVAGTMIGEIARGAHVSPRGAVAGDRILLTKGVPIEGTAILARELADRLSRILTVEELARAQEFLTSPGISVLKDAQVAQSAGRVNAMHDPTEGGIAGALWELADATGLGLVIDQERISVPPLSEKVCRYFDIDPLAAIASGSLLLATPGESAPAVIEALLAADVHCVEIGEIGKGPAGVWHPDGQPWKRPDRDEIARLFEALDR